MVFAWRLCLCSGARRERGLRYEREQTMGPVYGVRSAPNNINLRRNFWPRAGTGRSLYGTYPEMNLPFLMKDLRRER